MRYRSGGQYTVPMVIRTPFGGGIKGGHYHSQSSEAYFCHTPGLKVVVPSTPYDTKGLLTSAIRDPDPVMFLEPKKLYRAFREEVPEGEVTVPIGQAKVRREGTDLSIFAWGYMVNVALEAAERAGKEKKVEAEVADLRTLVPLDTPAILNSVKKTGRALVLYEAPRTGGYGAEVSAILPRSLPRNFSRSASFSSTASIGSPAIGPSTPDDHARGNPINGAYCGSIRCAEKRE